jgi:NitT/TauT family transport system substrate-binding protein
MTRRAFLLTFTAGAVLAACGQGPAASSASQVATVGSSGSSTAGVPSSTTAASAKPAAAGSSGTAASGKPAASAAGSAAAQPTTKLRVAYGSATLLNLPIWAAVEKGFFKKYGLDVELTQIQGSTITQALIGHSVDLIGSTASSTSLANLEGGDTLLVGSNLNVVHNEIVVNPKTIQKPEDLKGKTAAIAKGGDFSETAVVIALTSLGMSRGDVKYARGYTGDPDKLGAMLNGIADFASFDFGSRAQYQAAGMKLLFSLLDVKSHFIMSGIYTSRAFASSHASVLENYLKAMTESLSFFQHDKDGTLQVASKYMKEDPADIAPGYDLFKPHMNKIPDFTAGYVKESLSALESANPKAATANPSDFFDTTYLDNVRKSGFFDQIWGSEPQTVS